MYWCNCFKIRNFGHHYFCQYIARVGFYIASEDGILCEGAGKIGLQGGAVEEVQIIMITNQNKRAVLCFKGYYKHNMGSKHKNKSNKNHLGQRSTKQVLHSTYHCQHMSPLGTKCVPQIQCLLCRHHFLIASSGQCINFGALSVK